MTGTRADFGKIKGLIEAAKKNYRVCVYVTGMHMKSKYGLTRNEIEKIKGIEIYQHLNGVDSDDQDIIIAKTVIGFNDVIKECRPDLVIVHGDRAEPFAAAICCLGQNIRCCHIEGGELSGTIDEVYRHAITKLASYHLVSSENARENVLTLGEASSSVYKIGSPELDLHLSNITSLETVLSHYEIPFSDYGILTLHPVVFADFENMKNAALMEMLIRKSNKNFIAIRPNSDPGFECIDAMLDRLSDLDRVIVLPSIRFEYFSVLLRNASCVIGNSSVVVRECPFFGIPSINIGTRQRNRHQSESISQIDQDNIPNKIEKIMQNLWGKRYAQDKTFGEGDSNIRFMQFLEDINWSSPKELKQFSNVK